MIRHHKIPKLLKHFFEHPGKNLINSSKCPNFVGRNKKNSYVSPSCPNLLCSLENPTM